LSLQLVVIRCFNGFFFLNHIASVSSEWDEKH
jgi:hypothetical protein